MYRIASFSIYFSPPLFNELLKEWKTYVWHISKIIIFHAAVRKTMRAETFNWQLCIYCCNNNTIKNSKTPKHRAIAKWAHNWCISWERKKHIHAPQFLFVHSVLQHHNVVNVYMLCHISHRNNPCNALMPKHMSKFEENMKATNFSTVESLSITTLVPALELLLSNKEGGREGMCHRFFGFNLPLIIASIQLIPNHLI